MAWIPSKMITFSGAFRFAFGMALLGLAVVARYIGPASISKYKRVETLLCNSFNSLTNFSLFRIVLFQCDARRFPWYRTLLKRLSSTCLSTPFRSSSLAIHQENYCLRLLIGTPREDACNTRRFVLLVLKSFSLSRWASLWPFRLFLLGFTDPMATTLLGLLS